MWCGRGYSSDGRSQSAEKQPCNARQVASKVLAADTEKARAIGEVRPAVGPRQTTHVHLRRTRVDVNPTRKLALAPDILRNGVQCPLAECRVTTVGQQCPEDLVSDQNVVISVLTTNESHDSTFPQPWAPRL